MVELSESEFPNCREVSVRGELDLAEAPELIAALDRAVAAPLVLVDLSECEFIDSTGIAEILKARATLEARDGRLAICGASGQVARVLTMTGLDGVDLLFADAESALAKSQGHSLAMD